MRLFTTKYFAVVLFSGFASLPQVTCDTIEDLCNSVLPKDYKLYESPRKGVPINVYNRFKVLDIGEINEGTMDYLLHMFITTIWKESRIKLNSSEDGPLLLPKECLSHFWLPDIFFETAKKIDIFKSTTPAIIMKVYSDGAISVTIRYLFRCSCNMEFQNYPFDSQICAFFVALISPDTEAILCWTDEDDNALLNESPVISVSKQIEPLQFNLGGITTRKIVDMMPDANYTTLIADFLFNRRLIGSIINTYIPSTLIVLMSWFGFWLGVEAVPARVALSITSLLTLCTQVHQYQSQLPPVNYIKAMDIWLFVCIIFVFSTLLEFALAYNIDRMEKQKILMARNTFQVQSNLEDSRPKHVDSSDGGNQGLQRKQNSWKEGESNATIKSTISLRRKISQYILSLKFDECSKIFYPVSFISFAGVYWGYYVTVYHSNH